MALGSAVHERQHGHGRASTSMSSPIMRGNFNCLCCWFAAVAATCSVARWPPSSCRWFLTREFADVGDAHHMVAGDQNDAFATAVVDFLRGHEGDALTRGHRRCSRSTRRGH